MTTKNAPVSSEFIKQQRREFALYTITQRAIPYAADGLTASVRRNIWKARSGRQFKTETLAGITMSIHPHSATSDAISNAAAYYENNMPLFAGEGAFGTRLDPENHGAPRYTKVAISEFCKDVVLVDMDIVPMVDNYDHTEMEPAHFLPLVPIGLINPSEGIAIGYKASMAPRHPEAIIEAQIAVLQSKKINEDSLTPTFLPMDSIAGDYKETPKGRTYYFYGSIERINTSEVKILNIPYGIKHADVALKLDEMWDNGTIHSYVDTSAEFVDIVVKYPRGALKDKTDIAIIRELGLVGSVSEIPYYVHFDGNTIVSENPAQAIEHFTNWRLGWYLNRYQRQYHDQQTSLTKLYDVQKAIVGKLEQKVRKFKTRSDMKAEIVKLDITNVDYIADLPVYRFTEEEYAKNENSIAEAESNLKRLQDLIDNEDLRKKQFISELKTVLKNVKSGKYYPDIWYSHKKGSK